MKHPWKFLIEEIRSRELTQKDFSLLLWKKVSELNELIKWKRNITIQRDLLLSSVLWSPEKFRIHKQIDYDYSVAKEDFKPPINVIETKNNIQEIIDEKKNIDTESFDNNITNEENWILKLNASIEQHGIENLDLDHKRIQKTKEKENIFINF